jgi:hypothetical protein
MLPSIELPVLALFPPFFILSTVAAPQGSNLGELSLFILSEEISKSVFSILNTLLDF